MKRKYDELVPWINATKTRNYLLRDSLVDWLECYGPKNQNSNLFLDYIMQAGNEFEKKIVSSLQGKFPNCWRIIASEITDETHNKTVEAIKAKVPFIFSAPLRNYETKTQGIADLIVRRDYISKFIKNFDDTDPAPYRIIDIKFSTLYLRADGEHLLNSGSFPAYKGQVFIYNEILGKIIGKTPANAYILGRRHKYTSCGKKYFSMDPFDSLGAVNFLSVDSDIVDKVKKAVEWRRKLELEGKNWIQTPAVYKELYPNLCVDSVTWNKEKERIAHEMKDITIIWQCGEKQRELAIEQGVFTWDDPRCTAELMGFKNDRANIINKILQINRAENKENILPRKIASNLFNWRNSENEIVLDFETFCDIFSDAEKTDRIFLIGINSLAEYTAFTTLKNTLEEEKRIILEFIKYLRERNPAKIWYWHAEEYIWNAALKRHNIQFEEKIQWCDLSQLFKSEPIVIKGAFGFGLKEIASAMRNHGMIKSKLDSNCISGQDAALLAWKEYEKGGNIKNNKVIQDIFSYNKFDVDSLSEILWYLRNRL